MNKKLVIGGVIGALVLGGALAVGANDSKETVYTSENLISREKAEEIALENAPGVVEEVELERENGQLVYEVEVEQQGTDDDDKEIKVDAQTGGVVEKKVEPQPNPVVEKKSEVQSAAVDDKKTNEKTDIGLVVEKDDARKNAKPAAKAPAKKSGIITKEQAIKIAEKAVNGKVYEVERDEDDGRIEYELELKTKQGEVEIEIDGHTGKIIEIDYED